MHKALHKNVVVVFFYVFMLVTEFVLKLMKTGLSE